MMLIRIRIVLTIMLLHGAAFGSMLIVCRFLDVSSAFARMYVAAVMLPLALITVFAHPKGLISFVRRVVIWMSELTKGLISAPSAISTGAITRYRVFHILLLNC